MWEGENQATRRNVLKTIGAGATVVGLGAGVASATGHTLAHELLAVRNATEQYKDPEVAYADGFIATDSTGTPVELEDVTTDAAAVCGMGYHFANFANFGLTDPLRPQVLVYGEKANGDLVLGGVEYIVPTAVDANPDFFDHDGGAEVWDPAPPQLGDANTLHVWVHSPNPNGVFDHHNPRTEFSPDGCIGH